MQEPGYLDTEVSSDYDAVFFELLRFIAAIEEDPKLFPKVCRVCGMEFGSFAGYLGLTKPKGHVLEDCAEVMNRPYTMVYRHCTCGNTLVLTLTQQNMPMLETFWAILRKEAENSGKELRTVILDFIERLDLYITRGGRLLPPDS
jgi:hypothetical protein